MRVLHVIPSVAGRYGGPSTVITPMIAALNRLPSLHAEIATTDADGPRGRIERTSLPKDLPTHLFRRTFSERWKYSGELSRWLRRHVADYDLIHIHSLWSFSSGAAARAARRLDIPYIIRPAGMLSRYSLGRGYWTKKVYWRFVERATVEHAAAFHVTTDEEADEVRAISRNARTFVAPNGVNDEAWCVPHRPGEFPDGRCRDAGGRPIVVFLSRLHPKKGVTDLLLPALAQSKGDALLVIAGGADPHATHYASEVVQRVKQLSLTDRVTLLGPVTPTERWHLLDGADLFVLPSWSENFGVVVTEAMSRGRAVVVTRGVQAKSHVIAADAGRVVEPTAEALAAALDELIADRALRDQMGQRGRDYVRTRLSWSSIAELIANAYAECIEAARQKRYTARTAR